MDYPDDLATLGMAYYYDTFAAEGTYELNEENLSSKPSFHETRTAKLSKMAEADAKMTDKRCPHCQKPCPSYRSTCKHCGKGVKG